METIKNNNTDLPSILDSLFYHCIEVRITPTKDTFFDAWPGAIIRNNLLFAAEKVNMKNDISLRTQIDFCPISYENPFYSELKDGFPKGYIIKIPELNFSGMHLKKGDVFSFNLILIGHMSFCFREFLDAIITMCNSGLGHPKVKFSIIDICEKNFDNNLHLKVTGKKIVSYELFFPISFLDFKHGQFVFKNRVISINFITPIALFKHSIKKNNKVSYQDKSNGFPSFYQIVRSCVARMAKLTLLYIALMKRKLMN